ncbi:hypothetical protein MRX96_051192 [Rhipicephalus microplus]
MTLMSQLRTGGAAGGARRCWSGPSKLFLAGLVKGQQHRFRPIMEDPGKGRLHEFRPRARSFPVDQPLVRRPRKQRRTARRKDRCVSLWLFFPSRFRAHNVVGEVGESGRLMLELSNSD